MNSCYFVSLNLETMPARRSEVHAYNYISTELITKKGWSKQQVYTQQECQEIPSVAKYIKNQRPENVVEINKGILYIIEAKNSRSKLEQALKEAEKDYANLLNKDKYVKAL